MVHSDRLSAFDRHVALVPYKGVFLASINNYWLNKISSDFPVAKFSYQEPRVINMEKLKVFPVEMIVRGYLAGSMLRSYEKGQRDFCHHKLPEGLKAWGALDQPIITPTSKAEVGAHDENMTPQEILDAGFCTKAQWDKISKIAMDLFGFGRAVYEKHGWILVDTKYEFGFDENGEPHLIDEVHTPDSSRLWEQDSYAERVGKGQSPVMLDKEIIRDYLKDQGFTGDGKVPPVPREKILELAKVYLSVADKLYGRSLTFDKNLDQAKSVVNSLS